MLDPPRMRPAQHLLPFDEARRRWMATLPAHLRLTIAGRRVLCCHGSPRRVNEFLWESTTPPPFVERLLRECDADVVACTHTGLHWSRLDGDGRGIVNAGVLGRPANDGRTDAWYAWLPAGSRDAEFLAVPYDHDAVAEEIEREGLPPEFADTIRTGWWTTCLQILPAKERLRGRH